MAQPAYVMMAMPLQMAQPVASSMLSIPSDEVLGNVWLLSQDAQGCRRVQEALDISSEDVRRRMAMELQGHVFDALHNPHANFVVRKCVERLPPESVQFFVDELIDAGAAAVLEAARHRYGCRIIESLFSECPTEQLSQLAEVFLADAASLAGHMYGNFVIQRILQHGSPEQRSRIVQVLCEQAATLGPNFYASAVIGTALRSASEEEQLRIARALADAGVYPAIARFKHGPETVSLALEHLDEASQEAIRAEIEAANVQRQQAAATAAATAAQPKLARVLSNKQPKHRGHASQARTA